MTSRPVTTLPNPLQALLENAGRANATFTEQLIKLMASAGQADNARVLQALIAGCTQHKEQWQALQQEYHQRHLELWERCTAAAEAGKPAEPIAVPDKNDRRFLAPEWQQLPYFDYIKQAYLLNTRWISELIDFAELDAHEKHKLRFFARQWIDAASPANFPVTNPEVLKLAQESQGASLRQGIENLNADLQKGRISMTDESAFEVGRNLALTPGAVVYQNDLIQLIQYSPSTDAVYERPLLLVPPCINKYYILDLQPENSFVAYAVAQGHTVFLVSWRNVPPEMGGITWDEYLERGVIQAVDTVQAICEVPQINLLGFCIGGTLVCAALAVLKGQGCESVASLTLLTAMLDFSDTGDLAVFVDEAYVAQREQEFAAGGILQGKELALTFCSLRANELIWNYVVNNYLKGQQPPAFDLLYWNSDSTNLPGAMYAYYLRHTYLENNLRVPGKLTMLGVPVDLSTIEVPTYILAAREDHIVPWKTAYQSTQLLGGSSTFVLAASGHIAGVVNPPAKNKRHHWVNPVSPPSADDWLAAAEQHSGSWWTHWSGWLTEYGGTMVPARGLGNIRYPVLEAAPGSYVKQRCV